MTRCFNVRKATTDENTSDPDTRLHSADGPESTLGKNLYLPRKEVIHPQLPLRMPCYDLVPIAASTLVPSTGPSGICNSLDLTGGIGIE
jgi:hypothetical protein